MAIDLSHIQVVGEYEALLLRRKSEADRLSMALDLTQSLRRLIVARIREENPDWTEEQLRAELWRRYIP